jgi:hypothetical protein
MKSAFATVFALSISIFSFAQVQFGLKAGLNLSSVKHKGPDIERARIGFYAGGLIQWNITEKSY